MGTPGGARHGSGNGFRVALLFPGQGSQNAEMGALVAEHRPDLYELALEELGLDPFARIDDGTHCVQPALYAASLAGWERAGRPGGDLFAGHSLGELAALAAAGALDERDGLRLAVRRGELMRRAAERAAPGGMLALLGDAALAAGLAADHGLTVANRNASDQTVLSGAEGDLESAAEAARALGLRAIRLPVKGAFHSPAMRSAVPEFRADLDDFEFRPTSKPVISCVTAVAFEDPRDQLAAALAEPVRWQETLLALWSAGARSFVEVGPGKVLTNLVRRGLDGVEAISLDRPLAAHA